MARQELPLKNRLKQINRPRRVWSVKHSRKETQPEHLQKYEIEVVLLPVLLGFIGAVYETTVSALPTLCMERVQVKKLPYDLCAHTVQRHHCIIHKKT